jgi:hypothetical protein
LARWQWNGLKDVLDPWLEEATDGDRRVVLEMLAQLLDHAELDLGATVEGLPFARIVSAGRWSIEYLRVEQFHTFRLVAIR